MTLLFSLTEMIKADVRNRVRKPSFFFMIALTAYSSYLFAPPPSADYATVVIGTQRLLYNSAGIGLIFAILISTFALPGFYYIKVSITEDRQTGVGRLMAATPMHSITYLIGKWLSNLAIFSLLMVIMTIMAIIMQWTRAESLIFEWQHLLGSIWLIGLPLMSLIAGIAVLFETIPFLAGGVGSIAYFIIWLNLIDSPDSGTIIGQIFADLVGLDRLLNDIAPPGTSLSTGVISINGATLLEWEGVRWSLSMVYERVLWILIGLFPVLLGILSFDRFRQSKLTLNPITGWVLKKVPMSVMMPLNHFAQFFQPMPMAVRANVTRLTLLESRRLHSQWHLILWAELKIALKQQPWWWFVAAGGCFIYGLFFMPSDDLTFLRLAIFAPILIWSGMGVREKTHHTESILFSTPRPLFRQVTAVWLAGALVSLIIVGGAALRFAFAGSWAHLGGVLIGSLFMPAFALALGCWFGTSRVFELIYLLWWYALNSVPLQPGILLQTAVTLDFLSTTAEAISANMPLWYALGILPMLAAAYLGRWRYWQK